VSYTVFPIIGKPEVPVNDPQLPVTCPLCGRKNEFPVKVLLEGYVMECSHCKVKLTLHGHMLEDIQNEIARLKRGVSED
jgi:hypothetical protein